MGFSGNNGGSERVNGFMTENRSYDYVQGQDQSHIGHSWTLVGPLHDSGHGFIKGGQIFRRNRDISSNNRAMTKIDFYK